MSGNDSYPTRNARYAGSWYPGEDNELRSLILGTTGAAVKREAGPLSCAVLPHAGLYYSARGIAPLLCDVTGVLKRVLILSPSHYYRLSPDILSAGRFSGYQTPLGKLGSFDPFPSVSSVEVNPALEKEHALEMVLPFLAFIQERQGTPIEVAMALISEVNDTVSARNLASTIKSALGRESLLTGETLVIASSDFTHYGSRFSYTPFGPEVTMDVISKVQSLDLDTGNALVSGDLETLFSSRSHQRLSVCGIAGASVVSALASSLHLRGEVSDYYTSLDVTGEISNDFVAYETILWRNHD